MNKERITKQVNFINEVIAGTKLPIRGEQFKKEAVMMRADNLKRDLEKFKDLTQVEKDNINAAIAAAESFKP